jgi:hypothetical protein
VCAGVQQGDNSCRCHRSVARNKLGAAGVDVILTALARQPSLVSLEYVTYLVVCRLQLWWADVVQFVGQCHHGCWCPQACCILVLTPVSASKAAVCLVVVVPDMVTVCCAVVFAGYVTMVSRKLGLPN